VGLSFWPLLKPPVVSIFYFTDYEEVYTNL